MLDDLNARDENGEPSRPRPERGASAFGPLADREVPLSPVAATDVVHRWLDGELPEPAGMRGDAARSVDFWRRIGEETDRRRQMMTPPHVAARIMASLPDPMRSVEAMPWWKKPIHLSPATVVAAAVGMLLLGMLVMRLLAA
jgi:hypothetical protein